MYQFKKLILLPLAFAVTQFASTPAMAQAKSASDYYSGLVTITKNITITCPSVFITNSSGGIVDISFTSLFEPSDPNCNVLIVVSNPHDYTYGFGAFAINDLRISTITLGDCAGDISADWDGISFTIDTVIPALFAGPDCTIQGFAS